MRKATFKRTTKETDVSVKLNIDGTGKYTVETGIGFFNHMLELFSKHSLMDLTIKTTGDIEVDEHHTVEDTAIALATAMKEALGNKEKINRYGFASIPMDEALTNVTVDLGGRPYTVFICPVSGGRTGEMDFETVEEFVTAFASNLGANIHVNVQYGHNRHHIAESIFKALARALRQAVSIDNRETGIPSTKGAI
ncbi:MAG TPA: imidazoleglycerol-phosphate dehydratase HisB [Clostridia bacterium]|jgi:imidazoleglycerol-phosphate dehydratase|nr:imidazoleglycerol-phosphate dehydratase HisB [Clostridia bacterium]HQC68351.1 imidazoleglycerol-phosphate dehydratase HisB [Clostridia bacterium]